MIGSRHDTYTVDRGLSPVDRVSPSIPARILKHVQAVATRGRWAQAGLLRFSREAHLAAGPVISLGLLRHHQLARAPGSAAPLRFVDGLRHPVPHPEPVAGRRLPLRRREAAPGRQGVLPAHVVGGSGGGAGGVRGEAAAVR